ncbi:hypothetical protein G5V58_18755 [Nocardioides anomalus]|uniref:Choice-of-anchor G family protein n=1 Tax=Nocardioides anomalus TaxID=2712223 RepID=A0A6G6WHL1_9ACTN|nr:choice-of-anchor P family protein [Nocardioides anomalus]QIG44550.1 hypothetical protein G5V58_18755 [Nocardioides anomalus]
MKRVAGPVLAAGLAATSLGWTVPAHAAAAASGTGGAYSGYSSSGVATPVKIEVFEPTIPLPTVPQGEVDLGYSKVKANSAGSSGRASFLWPGDAIGEGLKTFFEQLGLPSQPVEDGYPVQVNSQYPSDTTTQQNTPAPGASMTTTSAKGEARSTVGFSTDCDAGDGGDTGGDDGSGDDGGPGDDGSGDQPLLPGLPDLPLVDNLDDVLGLLGLGRTSSGPSASPQADPSGDAEPPATQPPACQLPTALAAVVDVNGYVADAHSVSDGAKVTTTSRAALGDVRLLGGLVTLSGLSTTLVAASDGVTGEAKGRADYGTLTIAGQTFGIGPEGYVAQGTPAPIPGLPDDPAAALAQLGITLDLPQPVYKADGDKASGTVEGLVVTVDLKTLEPVLSRLDLGPLLAQVPFPPEAAPLKSLLGAVGQLSPRLVLHLGYTTAAVDTVQPLKIPATVPDNDPTDEPSDEPSDEPTDATTGGATGGGSDGGGAGGVGTGTVPPPAGVPTTSTPEATPAPLTDAALTAGLPPLFSIPMFLLVAGLGGAVFAGSHVRRLGALVLGGAGPCAHGLESGLPDLRKVQ